MIHIDYTAADAHADRLKAIAAYAVGLPVIEIQVDADLTPKGKRTARVVELRAMGRPVLRIRRYVGGRIFQTLPYDAQSITATREWINA